MDEYPNVEDIIKEIKNNFLLHPKIDVLTLTCNGEPTLYPKLNELIEEINKIKGNTKTLILSNGSTIYKEEIFNLLLKIDIVKLSLDCVSEKCFKKLDRVNNSIETGKIVPAMINFSKQMKNDFVIEILFVKDLNDKDEEIQLLKTAIEQINPRRLDLGTIDRPPAYDVKPISYESLENIANQFKNVNVNIVYKNRQKLIQSFNKSEIVSMLKRRPLTKEDIENIYDDKSIVILEDLIKNKIITIINSGGVDFYKCF